MKINTRLTVLRRVILVFIIFFTIILLCHLNADEESLSTSDLILILTALIIGWTSTETQAIVELTRAKEKPFLEIVFPGNDLSIGSIFRNEVSLKNFGQSPAYSSRIEPIKIGLERFEFDPLETSRLPIQSNETRKVWIYHMRSGDDGTIVSVGNAVGLLEQKLIEYSANVLASPLKIKIYCFDSFGIKCDRELFIKIGGVQQKKYIYTSTSPD